VEHSLPDHQQAVTEPPRSFNTSKQADAPLLTFFAPFRSSPGELIHVRAITPRNAPTHLTRDYEKQLSVPASITRAAAYTNLTPKSEYVKEYKTLNTKRGLYWVVCPGGNEDLDIKRFPATFSERDPADGADVEEFIRGELAIVPPLPTSAVMITYKSVHRYWLIDGECSREEWILLQQGQIAFYRSDPTISNESRVMRIPYFNHVRADLVNDRLLYKPIELASFNPERRYTVEQLRAAFPVGPDGMLKAFQKLSQKKYKDAGIEPSEELRKEVEATRKEPRSTSGRKQEPKPASNPHGKATTLAEVLEMQRGGKLMNEPTIEPGNYSTGEIAETDIKLIEGTIRRQCFRLANARYNTKHGTLWECGLILGGLVNAGLADEERIITTLLDAVKLAGASDPQFDIEHARATATDAVQKSNPTTLEDLRKREGKPETDEPPAHISAAELEAVLNAEGGPAGVFQPSIIGQLADLYESDDRAAWQGCKELLKAKGLLKEIEREIAREKRKRKDAEKQAARERKSQSKTEIPESGLFEEDGKIYHLNFESGLKELVANFTARITADIFFDDDVNPRRDYEISGTVAGETAPKTGRIKANDFFKGHWIEDIIGARTAVQPRKLQHVNTAVKERSRDCVQRHIRAYTGFVKEGEAWRFYHAGGAITAAGLEPADVELEGGLEMYDLPAPAEGEALKESWRFLRLLYESHDPQITAPQIAGYLLPLVDKPHQGLFAVAETGYAKTSYNLVFLSLYGTAFVTEDKPPADWNGRLFGHQVRAYKGKDLPQLIDEYVPRNAANPDEMRRVCAELLRSQGNHSGRTGGTPSGGLRRDIYPRGHIIGTGEDLPEGRSMRARVVVVAYTRKLDAAMSARLTPLQDAARKGIFARLNSSFIQWLCANGRIGEILKARKDEVADLRDKWTGLLQGAKVHPRTATNFASLERAWRIFLDYAVDKGLETREAGAAFLEEIRAALLECAKAQAPWLADSDPATRFVHLVGVALTSGRAHLEACDKLDFTNEEYSSVGWQQRESSGRDKDGNSVTNLTWTQRGDKIGWMNEEYIYLMPDAARRVVDSFAPPTGGTSSYQFEQLLKNSGLLLGEGARQSPLCRKKIGAKTESLYRFKRSTILDGVYQELDRADAEEAEEEDTTF
jgi:hypothetical protein